MEADEFYGYPLVLLLLQLVFGLFQLLLDLLNVFVHLPDGRVQDLPDEKPKRGEGSLRLRAAAEKAALKRRVVFPPLAHLVNSWAMS